ncbi:hypothetical protein NQD34_018350, partial [Periophthalmus magnuspinnatus]
FGILVIGLIFQVVPFSGTILGGLVPGEMLLIQGSVPSDVDRFQVDLLCGSSVKPRADVAFHLTHQSRRAASCVILSTRERLGREEIHKIMPFIPGDVFELVILVQSDVYKVAVNGAHLLEFKHRVELNRVDTPADPGKVQIQAIAVLPNQIFVLFQSVPFQAQDRKGLSPGRSITIKGRTSPNAQSLGVNLAVGGSSAIALHLNPRLKQRNFVRNSFLFDCWGPEETEIQDFPFEPDQYFEMIILCEASQFRVAVNGTHQFEYKHRVQDLSRVTVLTLTGDLSLEEVRLL